MNSPEDIGTDATRGLTEGELAAASLRPGKGFHSPYAHLPARAQTSLAAIIVAIYGAVCKLEIATWGLAIIHSSGQAIYQLVFHLSDQIRAVITTSGLLLQSILVCLATCCLLKLLYGIILFWPKRHSLVAICND